MVARKPTSREALRRISGVGELKLARYGEDFLRVIAAHGAAVDPAAAETLVLFRSGLQAPAIAERRGMALDTVYQHLAQAIEASYLTVAQVLPLPQREIEHIEEPLLERPDASLALAHAALGQAYSKGVIRCVKAGLTAGRGRL